MIMLPLNVFIYTNWAYGNDEVDQLNWIGLGITLAVVIFSITNGLIFSALASFKFRQLANKVGNLAGLALIIFSIVAPEGGTTKLIGRPWKFYFAVTLPIVFAMLVATLLSTAANMKKPERAALVIECSYQNTGIAISVVLSIYTSDQQMEALGVPFAYTGAQAFILGIYCLAAWKAGWTYAPKNVSLWAMISENYEASSENTTNDERAKEESVVKCNVESRDSLRDSEVGVVTKLVDPLSLSK